MLAQNFKTAEDLHIRQSEFDALASVLGMLERDEIRHVPVDYEQSTYDRKPAQFEGANFNMAFVFARTNCGAACCIADSCDRFFGTRFSVNNAIRESLPMNLAELFCPEDISDDDWDDITPSQAATALRSYLSTGEANWAEAIR